MNLKGKIFISTVSKHKTDEISQIFEHMGAEVINFPMTEIQESALSPDIELAFENINSFHWLIFTSANGVKCFFGLFQKYGKISFPKTIKIAAVGKKTEAEVKIAGYVAHFTGSGNTAEDLIQELLQKESLKNLNILLALGNLAPDTIKNILGDVASITRIDVYQTLKTNPVNTEPFERIKQNQYDLVLFTSPSGIENFVETVGAENIPRTMRIACIGQVTSETAKNFGLNSLITARLSTYEGLAHEILNYYNQKI